MLFKSLETITLNKVKRERANFILRSILPMPEKTVNMISSAGGMGKTFLSIRLASEFVKENNQKALCWFSEDHKGEIGLRFDTLADCLMVDEKTQSMITLINSEPKQFAIKENGTFRANYEALKGITEDCIANDIRLLIIDPLLAFYGGDENDNSQARIFMQPFVDWAKRQNITIIFIHHSNKNGGSTRGAGAFRDAVRTLYELNYVLDDNGEIDFNKKDNGIRQVSLAKDNRNAFYWFEKLYGGGITELKILPTRLNVEVTNYEPEYQNAEMPEIGF